MNDNINQSQSIAVSLERFLINTGYASIGDADEIRNNPFNFFDKLLSIYEKQSEEKNQLAADFGEKYSCYKDKRLDDIGEEISNQMLNDFKSLFRND